MKKTIILAIFALMFVTLPAEARAFKIERIFDPACIVLCDNEPDVVNNTNSNNVNSNVNSPNSIVVTTGTTVPTPVVVTTQTPVYVYDNNNYTSPLSGSCYSSYMNSTTGDVVVWSSSISGGNGNYYVSWSGTDGLSGTGSSVSIVYRNSGTKTASMVVTSGGQTMTRNCNTVVVTGYSSNNNYNNYNYDGYYNGYNNNNYNNYYNGSYNPYYSSQPLTVSCTANTSSAPVGATVRWISYVSGGYGGYTYTWTGTDNIYGTGQNVDVIYNSGGSKTASVTVRSNGQIITQACTNSIAVAGPVVNYNNSYNSGTTNTVVKYVEVPAKTTTAQKAKASNTVVESSTNSATLASLFSLSNVPWGLVAILIILILLFIIFYLMFNSKKI